MGHGFSRMTRIKAKKTENEYWTGFAGFTGFVSPCGDTFFGVGSPYFVNPVYPMK